MARPKVVAAKNLPGIGLHPNLEDATVPGVKEIEQGLLETLNEIP